MPTTAGLISMRTLILLLIAVAALAAGKQLAKAINRPDWLYI